LIGLVNFLILVENITEYDKKIIDKGLTPLNIYELCSCIRECFCLSYSIRKINNLFFYFQKELIFISFIGEDLRYLGPDERSQALLLEKALKKSKGIDPYLEKGRKQSTPGIYVSRFYDHILFFGYFKSLVRGTFYLITNKGQNLREESFINTSNLSFKSFSDDNVFILPVYENSNKDSKILNLFQEMKNIKFFSLSKIKQIENKILYLNHLKDLRELV
jgi:tRNA pseudouridine-54 N-methylase